MSGGEQGGVELLDGERLHPGSVRIHIGDVKAVAVMEFGVEEHGPVVIDRETEIADFVLAIVIHVRDADLVSFTAPDRAGPA